MSNKKKTGSMSERKKNETSGRNGRKNNRTSGSALLV
jgi:hypothetical protein